jgi:hypothetical protein
MACASRGGGWQRSRGRGGGSRRSRARRPLSSPRQCRSAAAGSPLSLRRRDMWPRGPFPASPAGGGRRSSPTRAHAGILLRSVVSNSPQTSGSADSPSRTPQEEQRRREGGR